MNSNSTIIRKAARFVGARFQHAPIFYFLFTFQNCESEQKSKEKL